MKNSSITGLLSLSRKHCILLEFFFSISVNWGEFLSSLMDWSLHTKCCTLAIATVTLGLSVIYLTRKTQEESVVQPEPEVEQKSEAQTEPENHDSENQPISEVHLEPEVQPELEIPNAQLEPEAEQKSEAQSESENLYDSENQPLSEVHLEPEVQPELEIPNAQLEPEAEQKSEAQSESGNLYDSENQLISEVHLEPEVQPELKIPNAQLELEVEMAGAVAVAQPIEALNIVASMEQMKLVEHQPDAAAPEEVELPDRDSANHSPSDFLSNNPASDTHSEVVLLLFFYDIGKH